MKEKVTASLIFVIIFVGLSLIAIGIYRLVDSEPTTEWIEHCEEPIEYRTPKYAYVRTWGSGLKNERHLVGWKTQTACKLYYQEKIKIGE